MALRLRIVSEHRRALGSRSNVVFGVGGGSIGRSADNDWVLPDSSRFVSGRHARVKFREGSWYIEDTSTNGTFLNDDDTPLGRRPPTPLHNGDMLRFGEYHVVVALDTGPGGADATAEQIGARLSASAAAELLEVSPGSLPSHLDISLSTSSLFRKESSADDLKIAGAFGQAVALPFSKSAPALAQPVEDSDIIAARRMERLARVMRERELAAGSAATTSGNADLARGGLEAFCRGAGLDVANLSNDGATSMLQLAGRLLREALVGLKDLDATRAELRHQFRLDEPPSDADEPFRMSAGSDDLLRSLLAAHESRRLDPVQWLRQSFEQSKKHQEGLGWASRAGFTEFIRQLDPKELEARFAQSGKRGLLGGTNNWDLYGAFYRSLVEAPGDGGVPHTYGESFAAAYRSVNKPRQS